VPRSSRLYRDERVFGQGRGGVTMAPCHGAASTTTLPEFEESLKSSRSGRQGCAAHSSQWSRDEWGTDFHISTR
ncbi:MAG: hypothetical protein WBQ94_16470, partial [Terracidiphilus sp.]